MTTSIRRTEVDEGASREPSRGPAGRWGWWTVGAVLASILLRLPFLRAPLGADEAGALTVARAWDGGRRLYVDAFVDRPQGAVFAFQGWDAMLGPSPGAIRALAVAAGILGVLGCAVTAATVARRPAAGAVAAWLVAIVCSSAAIEGYTANGELLAGAATVPAMAVAAQVVVRRLPSAWLVAAGALAATGLTVKQSGFDALVAIGLWAVVAGWRRWRSPREVVAMLGWLALGAGTVLGLTIRHGASLGWDAYRYAMVGFRLHARSAIAGPSAGRLALTLVVAGALLGPAVILAVRRIRTLSGPRRSQVRPEHVLLLSWIVVAVAGFLAGGNYHRHYVVQVAYPVATTAAVALTARPGLAARRIVRTTALALAIPAILSLALVAHPSWERDPRIDADVAIARWYREHRASPADDLLPLCASATWYVVAGSLPRLPYLWVDHVRYGRGGREQLLALIDGADRPRYLAMHQPAERCDPSGALERAIDAHYRPAATIDGVDVLVAGDGG